MSDDFLPPVLSSLGQRPPVPLGKSGRKSNIYILGSVLELLLEETSPCKALRVSALALVWKLLRGHGSYFCESSQTFVHLTWNSSDSTDQVRTQLASSLSRWKPQACPSPTPVLLGLRSSSRSAHPLACGGRAPRGHCPRAKGERILGCTQDSHVRWNFDLVLSLFGGQVQFQEMHTVPS